MTYGERARLEYKAACEDAHANGLVMVQVSKRRHCVIHFGGTVNDRPPRAWFSGTIVCGPDTYARCRAWIARSFDISVERTDRT